MLSFPTLVLTGFALKFPESWWAAPIVQWEGQMRVRATTHRVAGGAARGEAADGPRPGDGVAADTLSN